MLTSSAWVHAWCVRAYVRGCAGVHMRAWVGACVGAFASAWRPYYIHFLFRHPPSFFELGSLTKPEGRPFSKIDWLASPGEGGGAGAWRGTPLSFFLSVGMIDVYNHAGL